jgi:hypothetical protein
MSYNSTRTYIEYEFAHKSKKIINYGITAVIGRCSQIGCTNDDGLVIGQGNGTKRPELPDIGFPWIYHCPEHFDAISAKKQNCSLCNPKSKFSDRPKLCKDCYQELYNSNVDLNKTCQYPRISMKECNCKFCLM